jgi:outer membrane protein TolC
VVTETKRRYYGALAAKQFVGIAQATLSNTEENLKTISALFNEGLVAEFDQIRAQVAVDNVRPEVTNAEAGYNNALSALLTYLAMDITDTVTLPQGQLGNPEPLPNEDSAIVRALQENYDLKALELQIKVADGIVDVQRSTYYPTLTLFGQWQNQGQRVDGSGDWLDASTSLVGLNFSFNIFNGTRTLAQVEQAQADYESVREQYAMLKNNVKLQVRVIVNDLRSALQRIEAQQSTVQQAQRGFDISRIRYTEGTGSLLEINDAQVALSRAQVNRLSALLDYYVKRAEFDRTVGNVEERYLRMAE